jgi:PTH1 family peptidyl-tRNA hydrolase
VSHPIQLIVGLANPGKAYETTRHNAGAWFIHELITQASATLRPETKYHGLHAHVTFQESPCHLLIPTTFMNQSGRAVLACMRYYKIPSEAVLIAHDEIDLPVGTVKLKFDGGDGGHNGLKDIIRHLHTKQFYRLRIGVDRPTHSKEVVDYVLASPSHADRQKINQALQKAQTALPFILSGEIQKAMQLLHTLES